ncbi:unnamed protein product [Staurois parvus]|uniref:Uncharacterized protein n=1 Tax=Staurois parvus TaxID=386267 RepID=A0ABN9C195_9NEOB|nr:unnamed protein product [Staurois parvus]
MGHAHISVFSPSAFYWKGSGTFSNAKSCIFGSIDFNGNATEKHVVCFCCIFLLCF